jgi:ubiquitin-like 1-activating enzyme E1 B
MEAAASCRLLIVGAGGIGCELLKNVVFSGFRNITIIDLDTIEVSNLNRQFLFQRQHVGCSKSVTAAARVQEMCPDARIVGLQGNIKDVRFGPAFFSGFDLVMNALDNVDARRHVNRICMGIRKPLIESGTEGYLGQTTVHLKGISECFECTPKPRPTTYAVCTIRTTPDKPIHCIVWAKHLFAVCFGAADDSQQVTDISASDLCNPEFAFSKCFDKDIQILAAQEGHWKSRPPPRPLPIHAATSLTSRGAPDGPLASQQAWSIADCAAHFIESYKLLVVRRSGGATLEFDKDDDTHMDFVAAAANLRAHCFGIALQTRFASQSMAGSIIPAIATTNAIIAGQMVIEALRLLSGRQSECRQVFKCLSASGRRRLLLQAGALPLPYEKCVVCGSGECSVTLDIHSTTLAVFVQKVLKGELALNFPSVDIDGANVVEVVAQEEDEDEHARLQTLLPLPLSHPSIGFTSTSLLNIVDDSQGHTSIVMRCSHVAAEEGAPAYVFSWSSAEETAAAAVAAAAAAAAAAGPIEPTDLHEVQASAAADGDAPASKRARVD